MAQRTEAGRNKAPRKVVRDKSATWGLNPRQSKLALCMVVTSLEDRQTESGDSWTDTLICSEASEHAIPKSRSEVKCKDLHITRPDFGIETILVLEKKTLKFEIIGRFSEK